MKGLKKVISVLSGIALIAGVCLGSYITDHYIVTRAIVEGHSMEPTYYADDLLLFGNNILPDRGEVAIFRMGTSYIIKRVIGIPYDTIKIEDSKLYINGEEVDEPYIKEPEYSGYLVEGQEITLKEGEYFLCGDNRNHSLDSRKKGVFKEEDLIGTVLFHNKRLKS